MSGSDQKPTYRLVIDPEKCQGHNRCQALLGDLIRIDDLGFAHALGDGLVPHDVIEKARLAVRNCPEYAIRLEHAEKDGDQP